MAVNAPIRKDLGPASSYAIAVAQGYTGTEAEWIELLSSTTQNAQAAVAAQAAAETFATNAAGSASAASGSATAAANSASAASGSATSAAGSATAAAGSATAASNSATAANNAKTAAQTAQAAAETAQGAAEDILESIPQDYSDLSADVEELQEQIVTKAEIDGYYEAMTVGNAEQLVATVGVEDNAPYTFRTAGGSADIGDRLAEKLIGGTICWNQLADMTSKSGNNYMEAWASTIAIESDGVTVTTSRDNTEMGFNFISEKQIIANHKYLLSISIKNVSFEAARIGMTLLSNWNSLGGLAKYYVGAGTYSIIVNATGNGDTSLPQRVSVRIAGDNVTGDNFKFDGVLWIDLTQMFGSEIADYIYGLEQANAGDGVAWFRKYFPKPYYAYDPGSLQSVNVSAHKTTEFNQWDEEWELGSFDTTTGQKVSSSTSIVCKNLIPVLPNTTYYVKTSDNLYILYYRADGSFIAYKGVTFGNGTLTTPDDCYYIGIGMRSAYGTTYKNDICINLSWDGERDGEYEPYAEHVYQLDSSVQLRGMWKLDENNELYFDGDEYLPDGSVLRRFAEVDLGTCVWNNFNSHTGYFYTSYFVNKILASDNTKIPNALCLRYSVAEYNQTWVTDKTLTIQPTGYMYIRDDSYENDGAGLRASLSGIKILYELATPVIEQAESYVANQLVNDFGTEEYIDAGVEAQTRDVAIPVGHETSYQANLRAKLEMAPNSPDGDGLYAVRQTNGTNEYANITSVINTAASIHGDYDTLTAGQARQLVATVGVEDSVPYNFRTAGGSADIGDRLEDKIVGGTVCWNQLLNIHGPEVFVKPSNRSKQFAVSQGAAMVYGHKYLLAATMTGMDNLVATPFFGLYTNSNGVNNGFANIYFASAGTKTIIFSSPINAVSNGYSIAEEGNWWVYSGINSNEEDGATATMSNAQLIDLTKMFGATIADYIYSLEQATAGAGVAWFKKLFPNNYYAYNPGELMSVQAATHKTVGFNAWDEEWEAGSYDGTNGHPSVDNSRFRSKNRIRVIPGEVYYVKSPSSLGVRCYDENDKFLGTSYNIIPYNSVIRIPNNAQYIRFSVVNKTTYDHDICINLSWDGERDGEYEPYIEHVYPLDDSLTLRGIPKLDAANNLYYDGDTYESDGTVTRRYKEVDLGTLNWVYQPNWGSSNAFYATLSDSKQVPSGVIANMICSNKYTTNNANHLYLGNDKVIANNGEFVRISDTDYSDAASFKASVSGIKLVYELAEPTTETADPFQNPQIVDDFGTEEYVDAGVVAETRDVAIPVGHETTYQANLRAKLEMAPDSPDGNGDYIVRHVDGMNSYVPISFPADELPAAPTENGNYHLKCTVANGTATYTWEADT